MITTELRTLLLAQSSITALAPAQTLNRISMPAVFVENAQQGFAPPFVVISNIQSEPFVCHDGTKDFRTAEIDIDCYGYSRVASRTLADTIRAYIDDFTGTAGANTIHAVIWQDENDFDVKPQDGRDTRWYVTTETFRIQYE